MARPMLLGMIDELINTQRPIPDRITDIYEIIIENWISREANDKISKESLREFTKKCALYMLFNYKLLINNEEISELCLSDELELLNPIFARSKSLLNRLPNGNYKFAHKSIYEHLVSKYALSNKTVAEKVCEDIVRNGLNFVYYRELCAINLEKLYSDYSYIYLNGFDLNHLNLPEVNFSNSNLFKSDLSNVNLFNADLTRTNLSGANLSEVNLSEANLFRTNLTKANLSNANLTKANLSNTNLLATNLSGADLSGAKIYSANMSETNLSGANLSNANLSKLNLLRVNLSRSNLLGATISNVNIFGANLSEAIVDHSVVNI